MKKFWLIGLLLSSYTLTAQRVGINTNNPQATLDINGDIVLRSADLTLAEGTTTALDVNTNRYSYYRLEGPQQPFFIAGISQGINGREITLFNHTSQSLQINNEDATASAFNRIITGTGGNTLIAASSMITLQYDTDVNRWVVKSSTKSGGGASGSFWEANGLNIYNNNGGLVGIGTPTPLAPLCVVGTSTWGTASFTGDSYTSHINYPTGGLQNTYIRGGKAGSNVLINDGADLGNVGIGTANPSFKLDVNGTIAAKGTALNNNPLFGLLGGGLIINNANGNGQSLFLDGSNIQGHTYSLSGSSYKAIVLNPYGGNVGIGTNYTPIFAKLEVRVNNEQVGWAVGTATYNLHSFLGGAGRSANSEGCYISTSGTVSDGSAAPLHLSSNGQWAQLSIMPNGAIGIGTTQPEAGYKLSINGSVRAKEIRINSSWADYVFAKDYRLKPLEEVENYIQQHGHLPGIQDAATIEKEGVAVGEMQKNMMEKIEELTLYLIEANKRIRDLENKLQSIQRQ